MMKIQQVVTKIIKEHSEDKNIMDKFYNEDEFSLTIKKDHFLDFKIEKHGNYLLVGYYREQNGDLISDPIFAFEILNEVWHIIRVEQVFGDMGVGEIRDGQYYYYPKRLKDAKSFATSCANEWNYYYL